MDLAKFLRILRRWKWLILAFAALGTASGFGASQLMAPSYDASATIVVGQSLSSTNPDYQQLQVAQRLASTYAAIATKRPILEKVIANLNLTGVTPDDLQKLVSVDALTDVNLIVITASDTSANQAAAIANELANQLIAATPGIQGQQQDLQKTLQQDLTATQQQIDQLQAQVDALVNLPARTADQQAQLDAVQASLATARQTYSSLAAQLSSASSNQLSLIEPAVAPDRPSSPSVPIDTLLGGFLGLFLGLGLSAALDYLDDTVTNGEEAEQVTRTSTLGIVNRFPGSRREPLYSVVSLVFPHSPAAEAFRALRTNLEYVSVDSTVDSILVTSSVPGEGKSTVAANLAVVLAQGGRKTLLVDADLRNPSIHEMFRFPNNVGLTTVLRNNSRASAPLHVTEVVGLSVLLSGPVPPNPSELLGSERMRTVLNSLRESFDVIVLDSPPLTAVTDAAILSRLASGTLLVVRARKTRRGTVKLGREALDRVSAHLLGAVVNDVGKEAAPSYYGYYGQQPEAAKAPRKLWTPGKIVETDIDAERSQP
jgi:capsular exopolysaccharide synthesis family protein